MTALSRGIRFAYVSVPPAVSPRSPNVTIVSSSGCCTVVLQKFLQYTHCIWSAIQAVLINDMGVYLFYSNREGIELNHPLTKLSQEVTTRLLIELAKAFGPW